MVGRLQAEIQQKRPFRSLEEEVYLNVLRTADALLREVEQTLKPAGLSHTQYNVLRILRGAGSDGLGCGEIAERMLTRDPDITRLLDRLEARGLVTRSRERADRRVVKTCITAEGLRILKRLDEPMVEIHRRKLRHLKAGRLRLLVELLEQARKARA
jgi:DNA-binding MarR family transcriptional regulator